MSWASDEMLFGKEGPRGYRKLSGRASEAITEARRQTVTFTLAAKKTASTRMYNLSGSRTAYRSFVSSSTKHLSRIAT